MRKFNVSIPAPSLKDLKNGSHSVADRTKSRTQKMRNGLASKLAVSEDETAEFPPPSMEDLVAEQDAIIEALLNEEHDHEQAVIDSERLIKDMFSDPRFQQAHDELAALAQTAADLIAKNADDDSRVDALKVRMRNVMARRKGVDVTVVEE